MSPIHGCGSYRHLHNEYPEVCAAATIAIGACTPLWLLPEDCSHGANLAESDLTDVPSVLGSCREAAGMPGLADTAKSLNAQLSACDGGSLCR